MQKMSIIIIASILFLFIISVGIFYFQNQKTEREQIILKNQEKQLDDITNQDTITKTSSSTIPGTSEVTSNGKKIYSNPNLKYSIEYPIDWIFNTQYIDNGTLYLLTEQRRKDITDGKMVRAFDIFVKVYKSSAELPNNDRKLSFEDWIKQESDKYGFINRETIIIDGVSGYRGISYGDGESYLILVQIGDFIYEIGTGNTIKPTEIEQKIINSFKFI